MNKITKENFKNDADLRLNLDSFLKKKNIEKCVSDNDSVDIAF